MARIYNPTQFEGSFQSSAQSQGFDPEKAIDTSKHEKTKAQAEKALERLREKLG